MKERTMKLTNEEANHLDLLLRQELGNSNVELRHTISVDYRDRLKYRMEVIKRLLKKVETSKSGK